MKRDDPHATVVGDSHTAAVNDRATRDGAGAAVAPAERYCAFCGTDVSEQGPGAERFGQPFCSDAHAEEFVKGVRAARVQAAASSMQAMQSSMPAMQAAPSSTATGAVEEAAGARPADPPQPSWTDRLKTWACWGAPVLLLLALLLMTSGGGAAVTAGSLLSVLALLACPIGMYLMMRGMGNMNQGQQANQSKKDGAAEKKDE